LDRADLLLLFGLRLRTPRLELRLPTDAELVQLAEVAVEGVHPADEMPFVIAWTDEFGSPSFVSDWVEYHRGLRVAWSQEDWSLDLGVWAGGTLVGSQAVNGKDFLRQRTVTTASWLGQRFQGGGLGTEMRTAVLELAFTGLGAVAAESAAVETNHASARVSEKLGYLHCGESVVEPRGVPTRARHFRLEREQWEITDHPPVEITGFQPCLGVFGLLPESTPSDPGPRS